MAERYHSLPDDFEQKVDGIIQKRSRSKGKMKPDGNHGRAFKAYLGSLELTEEQRKKSSEKCPGCKKKSA